MTDLGIIAAAVTVAVGVYLGCGALAEAIDRFADVLSGGRSAPPPGDADT